jgi:hypothetical protein
MHFDAPHGNLIRPTILAHLSFSPRYSKCSQIFYGMHLILPSNAGEVMCSNTEFSAGTG